MADPDPGNRVVQAHRLDPQHRIDKTVERVERLESLVRHLAVTLVALILAVAALIAAGVYLFAFLAVRAPYVDKQLQHFACLEIRHIPPHLDVARDLRKFGHCPAPRHRNGNTRG